MILRGAYSVVLLDLEIAKVKLLKAINMTKEYDLKIENLIAKVELASCLNDMLDAQLNHMRVETALNKIINRNVSNEWDKNLKRERKTKKKFYMPLKVKYNHILHFMD